MFNYLAFVYGGVHTPGHSATADGTALAEQCLAQLRAINNPEQFPPRLLILLTSPAYNDKAALNGMLAAIEKRFTAYKQEVFADVKDEPLVTPLLGSSVEAVFFERQIHAKGALLICLASRLLDVKVDVCPEVHKETEAAVDQLLRNLNLGYGGPQSNMQKPLTDRLLLSFMPNIGRYDVNVPYLAPELHALLQRNRRALVGGVSTRPGFQYADKEVYQDALVVARISTGAPFGCSFGHGVQQSPDNPSALRVTKLDANGRIVRAFDQPGKPVEVLELKQSGGKALLGELSLDKNPFITVAEIADDGESVVLTRGITDQTLLCRLIPKDLQHLQSETQELFVRSLERWMLEKPAGSMAFHCVSRLDSGFDFPALATAAEEAMRPKYLSDNETVLTPYVGGFFAGECGGDESGRFLFGNWSVATLCLSDEIRERTPAHTGFKAIAEHAEVLTTTTELDEALPAFMQIITGTGFPGAILSLAMANKGGDWLVALGAEGTRYQRVQHVIKHWLKDDDILAAVAKSGRGEFIPDSRNDNRCDLDTVKESGIISQYILPLFDRKKSLLAVLQFDLGDLRRRVLSNSHSQFRLHETEEQILHSLGAVVQATLLRVFNRQETDLIKRLDDILKESLHIADREGALHNFLKNAAKLFQVEMAHMRLFNQQQQSLEMEAGTGAYYDAFKRIRRFSHSVEKSPTVEAFEAARQDKDSDVVVVVNDSAPDPWHQDMVKQYGGSPTLKTVLDKMKGYANVPIRNQAGKAIGTVSLNAQETWFFTRPRVRAMHALAQRISYLLNHFVEQEKRILSHVLDEFVRNADLTQPITTLQNTVESFCTKVQADVASLYLWDAEADKFILRAESGWQDTENWVDAARYRKGILWESDPPEPQYVPDLLSYKQSGKLFLQSDREYVEQMFKEPLVSLNIEAIALPLTSPKHEPLGILTLYRQTTNDKPEESSGFATTNPQRLREAAASWSAIVSMLLHNLEMNWLAKELQRHEEVRTAMETDNPNEPLEQRLCQQLLKSFHAQKVDLYLIHSNEAANELGLEYGACADEGQVQAVEMPDTFVRDTAQNKDIEVERHTIEPEAWRNPRIAKTEGVIRRIGLPLLCGEALIGVLDLHWRIERTHAALETRHNEEMLRKLADKIAVIYTQQKDLMQQREAKAAEERSRAALQFVGVVASHSAHLFQNTLQEINLWGKSFETTLGILEKQGLLPAQVKGTFIPQLFEQLHYLTHGAATKEVTKALNLTRNIKDFHPRPCHLRSIFDDFLVQEELKPADSRREWRVNVEEKLRVLGDYDLLSFAFHNVIHNALKHMSKDGVLVIRAESSPDGQTVQVVFKDTGKGMTPEQLNMARGIGEGGGMGLPTTRHLIAYQGGQFAIESELNVGTTVIITLLNAAI